MGRRKSTVRKPWDVLGLPKSTYFWKLRRGLITYEQLQMIKDELGSLKARASNCFSGRSYENSSEKLDAIREKYKNGITSEIWMEFVLSFGG